MTKPNKNLRRYRELHPRVDYYPSKEALEIIMQCEHLDKVIAGRIDRLIYEGWKAISGNR